MQWLFNPIGDFFVWSFKCIEAMSWSFDLGIIFLMSILTLYWFQQIWVSRKTDKGLFKKSS